MWTREQNSCYMDNIVRRGGGGGYMRFFRGTAVRPLESKYCARMSLTSLFNVLLFKALHYLVSFTAFYDCEG